MHKLLLSILVCYLFIASSQGYPQSDETTSASDNSSSTVSSTNVDSMGSSITKLVDANMGFASSLLDGILQIGNGFMNFGTELVSKVNTMFNTQVQNFSKIFSQ